MSNGNAALSLSSVWAETKERETRVLVFQTLRANPGGPWLALAGVWLAEFSEFDEPTKATGECVKVDEAPSCPALANKKPVPGPGIAGNMAKTHAHGSPRPPPDPREARGRKEPREQPSQGPVEFSRVLLGASRGGSGCCCLVICPSPASTNVPKNKAKAREGYWLDS